MTPVTQDAKVDVPKTVITPTTQGTDAIDAVKTESPDGVNLTLKSGPLPMILYKALNVLYAKDTGRMANFALENHGAPEKTYVYTVIGSEVNDGDLHQFGLLLKAAQEHQGQIYLLILKNESVPESDACQVLRTMAKRTNNPVYESLDKMLAGEPNV